MEAHSRACQHASGMTTAPSDTLEDTHRQIVPADSAYLRVALIGFGEVGGIFGAALAKTGVRAVTTFDVLIADASWASGRECAPPATASGSHPARQRPSRTPI